jgi:hypothetical protein
MNQLRVVKSLNNGIGVLYGQHFSLYQEVGAAFWMAGPGSPLLGIAKYLGRLGWTAVGKEGRSFTKGKVNVDVWDRPRLAADSVTADGSSDATILLDLSFAATSLPFLAQLSKTSGGKPTLVVAPAATQGTIWLFEKGKNRNYLVVYDSRELDRGNPRGYRITDLKSSHAHPKVCGYTVDLYDIATDTPSTLANKTYDGIDFEQHGDDSPHSSGFWKPDVAYAFLSLAPNLKANLASSGWVCWGPCFGNIHSSYLNAMKQAFGLNSIWVSSGPETGYKAYDGPFVFGGGAWVTE